MKLRPALLSVVLTAAAAVVNFAGDGAWRQAVEGWHLDFLLANVRDQFEKEDIAPSQDVVFVEFKETDKSEFSAWPPAPLDFIMALKRITPHEPEVIAFSHVLKWDKPDIQFVDELQQALVKFPQVVLAFSAVTGAIAESGLVSDDAELPTAESVIGDVSSVPKLSRLKFPDARLSVQMQLGFVSTPADNSDSPALSLVARAESKLVPSLAAQMIALQSHAPYASQRLRFGTGAGLLLGGGRFIPLTQDGSVRPRLKTDVLRVSALELLAPDLGDAAAKEVSAKLGKGKLVVLGVLPSAGEAHARLAAWALALPVLKQGPDYAVWIVSGVMVLLAFWQLRFGRMGTLVFGLCAVAALLGSALVVFQSSLVWLPPLLPLSLTLAGTLFCFLWPRTTR